MTPTEVGSRIQRLSTSVINKIAAGEVIERPASVVKELMENSVDALATRIEVDIEQGGSELIRIVDNGEGIHPDDVELAVTTHATSKIRDADDLFKVHTLGFRGEALASIAEISRFCLKTRQADQLTGIEMEVDGGIVKEPRPCGCPVGTQIDIRHLFWNTPVRRKFLKSPSTEFGHIAEQFTRIALAHPNLHLVLRHNGKTIFDLPASHELGERLRLFFGKELGEKLIWVESEHGGGRIWGYVAHPSQSKSTRKGQYLFLNGRWFQDRSLQHAVTEAYRGLVMVGRHPIVFLFLEVPPDQVDVNVHPTKSEVRFQDSQTLFRLILSTIRNRFLSMDLDSRLSMNSADSAEDSGSESQTSPVTTPSRDLIQRELVDWANSQLQRSVEQSSGSPAPTPPLPQSIPGSEESVVPSAQEEQIDWNQSSSQPVADPAPVMNLFPSEATSSPAPVTRESVPSRSGMFRAMQVHDCYLVVETDEGLTVIDQHALHERIMYEQLRRRVLSGGVEVQKLLMPVTLELSAREAGLLLDQQELLEELGLQVETFGGNTLALLGYPPMLGKADPTKLLRDIADLIESTGQRVSRRDLLDKLLHMMSCKAAIKAGQRLTLEEIDALLEQRHLCDDHHHCPHGRPTALTLSRNELDRQFGRLG